MTTAECRLAIVDSVHRNWSAWVNFYSIFGMTSPPLDLSKRSILLSPKNWTRISKKKINDCVYREFYCGGLAPTVYVTVLEKDGILSVDALPFYGPFMEA